MRVTRATQRAQQDLEEEHVEAPEVNERALKDIEPNTTPAAPIEEPLPAKTPAKTPAKKGKGKGGKKGAKSKKAKAEEEELAQSVGEAEREAAASSADKAAEQEPVQEHADDAAQGLSDGDDQPKLPQTPAVRLTRRQLAKLEEEEALSKSQRAPSPQQEENATEDAAEKAVEHAEVAAEVQINGAAEEDETPAALEEPTKVEPETAPKPIRRTRRQQAKAEEEQPEGPVSDDTAETVTEQPEATVEAASVVVADEAPAVLEIPAKTGPEPVSKPVRLTRRQQAKLEEEQKQSQAVQQIPQPEATEEEVLEEIVAETQAEAEAVAQQEVVPEGILHDETNMMEDVTPTGVTGPSTLHGQEEEEEEEEKGEGTEPQDDLIQIQLETVEKEVPVEAQPIESPTSEAAEMEDVPHKIIEARPATPTEAEFEVDLNDGTVPEEAIFSVKITSEAEPKMLHAEKPFEGTVSTPTKNQGSIRRTSQSSSKSPMCIEESISAIDRLEEDLESIGKAIPVLDHSDDEKSPQKPQSPKLSATSTARGKTPSKTAARTSAKTSTRTPAKLATKTPSKTPAKAPIPARGPVAARASVAPKPPLEAKAALPTRISRVPSAAPKSVKPTTTSLACASSVRTAPSKDITKPSTETVDYLASKRRPISLSFPTPPPPPKGRAPTKPTFQLSSDNVAARLKAQREERLKREAEGAAVPKQRPISMPPPPKLTKPPTVPSFQLPGEATAAKLKAQKEERLKRMEEARGAERPASRPISMPPPPKSTKQLTKPSFQLPGEATAARLKAQKEERLKRMEEAEAAKKAAAAAPARKPITHRPRESLLVRDAPGVSIPPPPQPDAPQRSTSLASKRSSIVGVAASRSTSTSSANRDSILLAEGGKSTVTPVDAAALKVKGKQVYNRDRMEKEAMERERREKEEAAKRARAEAAERGRIASREWAERQRKKLTGQ